MKYTFRSEKELQEVIQACAGIPQKVIDNAKYHIGLVEECFEDGACGNFYILTDDDGIQYTLGHSSFVTSMNIYVGVFDDIRDVAVVAAKVDDCEHLVEEFTRRADERLTLQILIFARPLADEQHLRVLRADAKNDVVPRLRQRAAGA